MNLPADFDFTQGNLQDYVDCAYRFYLRYILHARWPALLVDDALDFEQRSQIGGRFHRLIQQYLLGVPENRISALAEVDPSLELSLWWHHFLVHVRPWLDGQLFVETTLSTTLSGHRLVAKYDLILYDEQGTLIIFDWKTSQKRIKREWLLKRIQTRLYRFILTDSNAILIPNQTTPADGVTMHYWFAPHPESPVMLPYKQTDYEADKTYFISLLEEIQQKPESSFRRTDDLKKCHFCVYRSLCDRGIKAGDLESFEDFEPLSEEIEPEVEFENIAEIEF